MISTPAHRASRRRQREALPAWRDFLGSRLDLPPIKPVYDAAFGSMHTSPRDRGARCNTCARSGKQRMILRFEKRTAARDRKFEDELATTVQSTTDARCGPISYSASPPPEGGSPRALSG